MASSVSPQRSASSKLHRTTISTPSDERQEILESERAMRSSASNLSRPSDVSKAKFKHWESSEERRQLGDQMRTEANERRSTRQSLDTNFHESLQERTRSLKAQREAASLRVQQHREANAARGAVIRRDMDEQRQALQTSQLEWNKHSETQHHVWGDDQKKRMLETRQQVAASNQSSATEAKRQEAKRQVAHQRALAKDLQEKRDRVERIRAETQPQVANAARDQFYAQRRAKADAVRADVSEWRTGKQTNTDFALGQARAHREEAYATRQHVGQGQTELLEQRRKDATAMRQQYEDCRSQRKSETSAQLERRRGMHDSAYEDKYVGAAEAELVSASSLETLENFHRAESPRLTLAESPRSTVGKSAWNRFVHTVGWFSPWAWSH